jgi:hypothetical protein
MKYQHRQTKPAEPSDLERPQKKRGGKPKPYVIYSTGWDNPSMRRFFGEGKITLGRYETLARAEQALPKLARTWANCVIERS